MPQNPVVTVAVVGGPTIAVTWTSGMNAQQALELAVAGTAPSIELTYAVQYYGPHLGYLVVMLNETFESFVSGAHPFYFWEFLVNGTPAQKGIDGTILNGGDTITFELQLYSAALHAKSTVAAKFGSRFRARR